MVRNVARVVAVIATMVGATTDVGEEVIGAHRICTSSMVVVVKLLKLVVHVIWSTVNMRPFTTTIKLG